MRSKSVNVSVLHCTTETTVLSSVLKLAASRIYWAARLHLSRHQASAICGTAPVGNIVKIFDTVLLNGQQ